MSAQQPAFEQRDNQVNLRQQVLTCLLGHDLMPIVGLGQPLMADSAVRFDGTFGRHQFRDRSHPGRSGRIGNSAQTQPAQLLGGVFDGHQDQRFACGPLAVFAELLASPIRLIQLHDPLHAIPPRADHHPA